jgi:hypothetical protein
MLRWYLGRAGGPGACACSFGSLCSALQVFCKSHGLESDTMSRIDQRATVSDSALRWAGCEHMTFPCTPLAACHRTTSSSLLRICMDHGQSWSRSASEGKKSPLSISRLASLRLTLSFAHTHTLSPLLARLEKHPCRPTLCRLRPLVAGGWNKPDQTTLAFPIWLDFRGPSAGAFLAVPPFSLTSGDVYPSRVQRSPRRAGG